MANSSPSVRSLFPGKKIVIVGDLVADQFLKGTISRVSREAPVFILKHEETETRPGAAANAAANVASLGARPVLIGVVGEDAEGRELLASLERFGVDCKYVRRSADARTTTKVRVLAGQHYAPRQQVIRIDYENTAGLSEEITRALGSDVCKACADADAVIISDYNYGVATPELAKIALAAAGERGIPVVVDSRFRLKEFPGAASATPNQEEAGQILGKGFSIQDCERLRLELKFQALLVTCGNEGMMLAEAGRSPIRMAAVGSAEPVDVTGAGDTVIAAYTLALACRMPFADASRIANYAGGIVVMKKGTATVSLDELAESVERSGAGSAADPAVM